MKKKIQIHQFDPIIYPYKLWIIVNKSPGIIAEYFDEYSGDKVEFIETDTKRLEAFTMSVRSKDDPKYGVVIFFRSREQIDYEIAAHESSHAAKYLFEHIGASVKEHEPFEYVVGWIASCIQQVKLNKFK